MDMQFVLSEEYAIISAPQSAPGGLPNPAARRRSATGGCTRSNASRFGLL